MRKGPIDLKDLSNINLFEELDSLDKEDLVEATLGQEVEDRMNGKERKWHHTVKEDDLDEIEQKMKALLDNPTKEDKPGDIEKVLNKAYNQNKWMKDDEDEAKDFVNVLFVGPAGTGKTSRIKRWAESKGVNLVHVLASTLDDTDMGGAISPDDTGTIVKRLATTEMDELGDVKDSVLFLDEFNRGYPQVRGTLLTLIQDHTIPDPRVPGRARYLPNFLFTIAAINPDDKYNTNELDPAELTRFKVTNVKFDKNNTRSYLLKVFSKRYEKEMDRTSTAPEEKRRRLLELRRKYSLVDTLLSSPKFQFEVDEDPTKEPDPRMNGKLITSARTLTNLLNYCDGTKQDFLDNWDDFCNPAQYDSVEDILRGFSDVQNKANSVFAKNRERKGDVDFIKLL